MGAEGKSQTAKQIRRICGLAEDEDCLEIIRQVEAREKAGIKSAKLELKRG